MSKHTPVPYEILYGTNVVKGNRIVANCGGYSDNTNPNTLEDNKANAHFIVTACNAHAALLKVCERIQQETYFPECWSAELEAAIQKATSEDE